jgi:host factor-I protein
MQKNTGNLQEVFLTKACRAGTLVTVFLMNGFQMHGVVAGYDSFVVFLDSEGKQQMIYKHAISTIIPMRPIDLNGAE